MSRLSKLTENPPIRIYVNKLENGITFIIKEGYYLQLWTNETKKSLLITKNKINQYKNCENVPHVEIAKVVLVHWNTVFTMFWQCLSSWFKSFGYNSSQ